MSVVKCLLSHCRIYNVPVPKSLNLLTDSQLLDLRLCDLRLDIVGTPLEKRVKKLYRELEARSVAFRPNIWLAEEWFTPDDVSGFGIPFYLAHPRLMRLERAQMLEVEGAGERECMRLLRHETGHALDNAYRLHARRSWREIFGSFHARYPDFYVPRPNSRNYVLHLNAWYAQAHPAEDFAETFAVWLANASRWRHDFQGWRGALRKLEYVDTLMNKLASTAPPYPSRRKVDPLSSLKMTLREHYQIKRAHYIIAMPASYERMLYRLFSDGSRYSSFPDAAQFLRHRRHDIAQVVASGTGVHPYTINHIMKQIIVRCRQLGLHLTMPDKQTTYLMIANVTTKVMQIMKTGYHRIPL
jgi:hypothetical protein